MRTLLLALVILAACDDPGSDATTNTASTTNADAAQSPDYVNGRLGIYSFWLRGGLFYVDEGTTNIVLGDFTDVCGHWNAHTFADASKTIELYDLPGTGPGTYESPRASAFVISGCYRGQEIDESTMGWYDFTPTTASVTITSATAERLIGSIELRFLDGSYATGAFDVRACDVQGDGGTCE